MSKKNYKSPNKDDLVSGNILDIYGDSKSQTEWLGKAILIEPRSDLALGELPFIKAEVGGTKTRSPQIIIWSRERWLVEFVEGPMKGHKTCRYIAYFLGVGIKWLDNYNIN